MAPAEVVQVARPNPSHGTLSTTLESRDNPLNFIRLVLASLVIIGHVPPVMGVPTIPLIHELGNWAVNGFFVITGFLIAGSRARSRWWPYLWRRALRIFPAYWVALIVVAFLAAPLVAALVPGRPWSCALPSHTRSATSASSRSSTRCRTR